MGSGISRTPYGGSFDISKVVPVVGARAASQASQALGVTSFGSLAPATLSA